MAHLNEGGQTAPTAEMATAPKPRITSEGFVLLKQIAEKAGGKPGETEERFDFVLRNSDGDVSYWRREQILGIHSLLLTLSAGRPGSDPITQMGEKLGRQIVKHAELARLKGGGRIVSRTVVDA